MIVRDMTKPKKDYKGRQTWALDETCPCRSCYNPHDFGYRHTNGKWIIKMHCATNYNSGCPDELPKAQHIIERHKCKRCNTKTE